MVTLICHGHHVNSPFWNLPDHKVRGTQATMKCLFTKEELEKTDYKDVMKAIEKEFEYDDYTWQKENNIKITYPQRARGLHKILYKCPACKSEFKMTSGGTRLCCNSCGKEWEMTELGELQALTGPTEFSHIPDWYEWERAEVRKEVEAGTYGTTLAAQTDALPNAARYIDIGDSTLTHDMTGFTLTGSYEGKDYCVKLDARSQYSVHIEYDYLGKKGDCVDLNTINDTLYVYPKGSDFSVTKMALATEELYKFYNKTDK